VNRGRELQRPGHDLYEIVHGQGLLCVYPSDAILKHLKAEGAGTADDFRVRPHRLFRPHEIHLARTLFIHPGMAPACATAQSPFSMMLHLNQVHPWHPSQDLARRFVNAIMAPQIAGIVVRDGLSDGPGQRELALSQQLCDELGMMDDLELAAEVGVLIE
jgi:hypothetical protein